MKMKKSIVLKMLTGVTTTVLTVTGIAVPTAISSRQNTDDVFAVAEEDARTVDIGDEEIAGDVTVDYDWLDNADKEQAVAASEQHTVSTQNTAVNTDKTDSEQKAATEKKAAEQKAATEKAVAEKAAAEKTCTVYTCDRCGWNTIDNGLMLNHTAAHNREDAQNNRKDVHTPVTLPANDNVLTASAECVYIVEEEPEPKTLYYVCGDCGYATADDIDLADHVAGVHFLGEGKSKVPVDTEYR